MTTKNKCEALKPLSNLLSYRKLRDFEFSGHVYLKSVTTNFIDVDLEGKNAVKPYCRVF